VPASGTLLIDTGTQHSRHPLHSFNHVPVRSASLIGWRWAGTRLEQLHRLVHELVVACWRFVESSPEVKHRISVVILHAVQSSSPMPKGAGRLTCVGSGPPVRQQHTPARQKHILKEGKMFTSALCGPNIACCDGGVEWIVAYYHSY
jgi:hypothetical protein